MTNVRRNGVVCALKRPQDYQHGTKDNKRYVFTKCGADEIVHAWDLTGEPVSCLGCIAEGEVHG